MLSISKLVAAGLFASANLLIAGCQSSGTQSGEATASPSLKQAVACEKCKTTWVKVPNVSAKGYTIQGYTMKKRHQCPDCKDAVASFFATGKFEHTCRSCGDSLDHCEIH